MFSLCWLLRGLNDTVCVKDQQQEDGMAYGGSPFSKSSLLFFKPTLNPFGLNYENDIPINRLSTEKLGKKQTFPN